MNFAGRSLRERQVLFDSVRRIGFAKWPDFYNVFKGMRNASILTLIILLSNISTLLLSLGFSGFSKGPNEHHFCFFKCFGSQKCYES